MLPTWKPQVVIGSLLIFAALCISPQVAVGNGKPATAQLESTGNLSIYFSATGEIDGTWNPTKLAAPVVAVAAPSSTDDQGAWLVGSDGGVFAFGDAPFLGSLPSKGVKAAGSIVGMAAAPGGGGYWLVGSDGGVFAFGDAPFLGSLPSTGVKAAGSIVGMAAAPGGGGYWLVGSDGGVFAFGDAPFLGSLPSTDVKAAGPIVGMAAAPGGGGYWLVGSDGGVFAFGDAPFLVSAYAPRASDAIALVANGGGYAVVDSDESSQGFGSLTGLSFCTGVITLPPKPVPKAVAVLLFEVPGPVACAV